MEFQLSLAELLQLLWHKASASGGNGNCVEVANTTDGRVIVRDTKNRDEAHLTFSPQQWDEFIAGVNTLYFD